MSNNDFMATEEPKPTRVKERTDPMRWWHRMFGIIAIMLLSLELYLAGYNAAKNEWGDMIGSLVIAAFWLGGLVIVHLQRISDVQSQHFDQELKTLDWCQSRISRILKSANEDVAKAKEAYRRKLQNQAEHEAELRALVYKISNDVTGGDRPPTPEEVGAIEKAFAEQSDGHYVKLELVLGGVLLSFAVEPFPEAQADETADDGAKVVTIKKRKPTKAQQRKANEKKGHGPITDDELKAKRAEARRAQRAAKKAAQATPKSEPATTTTTTTVEAK